MSTLQNDIRLYVRKARKTAGSLMSFENFNNKFKTNLPIDENALLHQEKFKKSLLLARKKHGMPVTVPLYNLLKYLNSDLQVVNQPSVKRELIPPPSISLKPHSGRSISKLNNNEELFYFDNIEENMTGSLNSKEINFFNRIRKESNLSSSDFKTATNLLEKLMKKEWEMRNLIGDYSAEKMFSIWNKDLADGETPYEKELLDNGSTSKITSAIGRGIWWYANNSTKKIALKDINIQTKLEEKTTNVNIEKEETIEEAVNVEKEETIEKAVDIEKQQAIEKAVGNPSKKETEEVETEELIKLDEEELKNVLNNLKENDTKKLVENKDYSIEDFKSDLEEWKSKNPSSKLCNETQIVYFVGHEKVENPENFASKLTRKTGAILETGGVFKMRSGLKKNILGMDKLAAKEIIENVTSGGVGPFFLKMACNTGAKTCNCHLK